MGLQTDLNTANALKTSLTNDAAGAAALADVTALITDLGNQIAPLNADLATANALKTSLAADGANSAVMADITKLITDLTAVLS
jgi:hypothetical protein